jgi:rsbT co-antagonist protein RsbR
MGAEMLTHQVELNQAHIEWNLDLGTLSFAGRDAAMFWLDPSMLRMLEPLAREVGIPLYRLLVAYWSSRGTDEDHATMITILGKHFVEGFLAWGNAVSAAGWGRFEVPSFEPEQGTAVVRVYNPWELRLQRSAEVGWGCPFLFGKLVGIFSHALDTNCWAEEVDVSADGTLAVEFRIHPSSKTIADEIENLRRSREVEIRRPLQDQLDALWNSEEKQRAIFASLGELVFTIDTHGQITSYHVPADQFGSRAESAIVGRHVRDTFSGEVADAILLAAGEVLAGSPSNTVSYEREHGAEHRTYSTKLSPLYDAQGAVVGVTALERDITERVRIELELNEKLTVIEKQQQSIRELSSPILQVWEGIIAVPIVGIVDSQRAANITENLLQAVVDQQARYVILDLTGVDVVDTSTADHFGKITRGVTLLGAECLVCGIRPAVAQAIASLNVWSEQVRTFATMQSALRKAMGRVQ